MNMCEQDGLLSWKHFLRLLDFRLSTKTKLFAPLALALHLYIYIYILTLMYSFIIAGKNINKKN